MPQLIPAIVAYGVQAATVTALGTIGAGIAGAVAGGLIASALQPTQKSVGPRLGDLRVQSSRYGTIIPFVVGSPRIAGQVIWASNKKEISTVTSSGKGGGSQSTNYTYSVDLLILLTDNVQAGVTRVWIDGALVWNKLSSVSQTVASSSDKIPQWTRMTPYGGGPTQLTDPTYEAAVGTANAPAYRGRLTVFIEGLQLGSSGQIPNITFEIATAISVVGAETVLLLKGSAGPTTDSSSYAIPLMVGSGTPSQVSDNQLFGVDTIKLTTADRIDLVNTSTLLNNLTSNEWCIELWHYPTGAGRSGVLFYLNGTYQLQIDSGGHIFAYVVISGNSYGVGDGYYVAPNMWHHIALVRDNTTDPYFGVLRLYVDGVLRSNSAQFTKTYSSSNGGTGSSYFLGYGNTLDNSPGWYADLRWTKGGRVYTGNFTPPTKRLVPLTPVITYS